MRLLSIAIIKGVVTVMSYSKHFECTKNMFKNVGRERKKLFFYLNKFKSYIIEKESHYAGQQPNSIC